VQPKALVTVKEYVPVGNPLKVVVNPVPVAVNPAGVVVTVQVPDDGNPDKATLPVAKAQVGCVIVPTIGADGGPGWLIIVAVVAEAADVQPEELVTVNE